MHVTLQSHIHESDQQTQGRLKMSVCALTWRRSFRVIAFLSVGLGAGAVGISSQASSQNRDDDFRFRPDHERESLKSQSAYLKFQAQDGIPVYTGVAANLYDVKVGPWRRQGTGVTGAYVNLDGSGAI